jgi:uncharacterized OB-fold protein
MSDRPMPKTTSVNRPFWEACDDRRLIMQRCQSQSCGRFVFYPRVCCPHCGGGELKWEPVSGRGKIETYTKIYRPQHESFQPEVPIYFIAVRLEEGPLMYSRLEPRPEKDDRLLGSLVEVTFSPPVAGHRLPYFALKGAARAL